MKLRGSLTSFASRETALVLLQLALWSELGVLTRIYVDRLFNDGCSDGWGLCLTSERATDKHYGAQFYDLPANMLGCFVMGLLSTGSVLGLKHSKKTLAILPESHRLQGDKELQVGLRTGYCGSLTTFASWELSLLQLLIGSKAGDGGQWQQWLWGFIIGFELAYASHLVGEHAALFAHTWLLREGSQEPQQELNKLERPTEAQEEQEDLYGADELNDVTDGRNTASKDNAHGQHNQDGIQLRHIARPDATVHDIYDTADSQQVMVSQSHASQPTQHDLESSRQTQRNYPTKANKQKSSSKPSRHLNLPIVTVTCGLLCVVLTALWIVLAILDSERKHSGRRQQWFALLFAPFGCILRWLLSKLNTMEHRPLPWFPVGTFAANMIACAVDFIIAGITNRYTLGYWPMVILPAIRVGYAGSLSTVSTFIAEVRAQLQGWPEKLHGYIYPFITISTGVILGIALYGWSVWRTL